LPRLVQELARLADNMADLNATLKQSAAVAPESNPATKPREGSSSQQPVLSLATYGPGVALHGDSPLTR
jgi:hypothetical protein